MPTNHNSYPHSSGGSEWDDENYDPWQGEDPWADSDTTATGNLDSTSGWDDWDSSSGTSIPSAGEVSDDGWGDYLDEVLDTPDITEYTAGSQELEQSRESRLTRIKAAIGRGATRLVELVRGRSLGGAFGSEGSVARGIDRANNAVDRADKIANSRTARVASKVPIVGKYVKATRDIVGTAKSATEIAGHYSNMAGAAEGMYGDRAALMDDAKSAAYSAGKEVAFSGVDDALSKLGERTGVSYDREAGLSVSKRKLGRFAVRLFKTGGVGELVSTAADVAKSGVDGARVAAEQQAEAARLYAADAARGIYDNGYDGSWAA